LQHQFVNPPKRLPAGEGEQDILCDEPTYMHSKFKARFEELQPLTVKGKKLPVLVFKVVAFDVQEGAEDGAGAQPGQAGQRGCGGDRPLVGRQKETCFILDRTTGMVTGRAEGGAIIVEGNTGAPVCSCFSMVGVWQYICGGVLHTRNQA
jgi:hypothetical protein